MIHFIPANEYGNVTVVLYYFEVNRVLYVILKTFEVHNFVI